MSHYWKPEGPAAQAVTRSCKLCGAGGRRFRAGGGYTPWETRFTGDGAWTPGVPACPSRAPTTQRALAIAPGQTWSARDNESNVIRVTTVDDDLVAYQRVAGSGRSEGRLRARSLLQYYAEAAAR